MTMNIIEVKQYSDRVKAAMDRLIPQLSPIQVPPSKQELSEIIESPSTILLIAEKKKKIIGSLTLIFFRTPTGLKTRIEDVIVDQESRGEGVGESLVRYAIHLLKETDAKSVDLTSGSSRESANRLYRKIGFEQRETNVYRYNLK